LQPRIELPYLFSYNVCNLALRVIKNTSPEHDFAVSTAKIHCSVLFSARFCRHHLPFTNKSRIHREACKQRLLLAAGWVASLENQLFSEVIGF
jgi:hypothetical protein